MIRATFITTFAICLFWSIDQCDAQGSKSFVPTAEERISSLTEEQLERLQEMHKAAAKKQYQLFKAAEISKELSDKRKETYERLRSSMKGKQLQDAINQECELTEAQIEAFKQGSECYRAFRFLAMKNVLTAEQRAMMTKYYRDDYAKSLEIDRRKRERADEQKKKQ